MLTCFNVKKKTLFFQILYIIVGPLCPASLKRFVFYKVDIYKIMLYSLNNWGAWAQINEAYHQSVPKINTKPLLIERKQVDKKSPRVGDNIAEWEIFQTGWSFLTRSTKLGKGFSAQHKGY